MPKPVCVKCQLFYQPKKNDIYWEEGMPRSSECPGGHPACNPKGERFPMCGGDVCACGDSHERCKTCEGSRRPGTLETWGPYKLWNSDLWECRGCGTQIIIGHGRRALAEHFAPDYTTHTESRDVMFRVDDC